MRQAATTTPVTSTPAGAFEAWRQDLDKCLDTFRSSRPGRIEDLRRLCASAGSAGIGELVDGGFMEVLAVLRALIAAESFRVADHIQSIAGGSAWAATRRDALAAVNNPELQRLVREFIDVAAAYANTTHKMGLSRTAARTVSPIPVPEAANVRGYPNAIVDKDPAPQTHPPARRRRRTPPREGSTATVSTPLAGSAS